MPRSASSSRPISHFPAVLLMLVCICLVAAWIGRLLYLVRDQVRLNVDPTTRITRSRASVRVAVPRGKPLASSITSSDGTVMLLVPQGEFPRGVPNPDVDDGPQITDWESAFYVDRTEVSVAQFLRFVRTTGYVPRGPWQRYVNPDHMDLPVTGVTAEDAEAYAKWLGKRLPTEAEWEKAARGSTDRTWPWGDHPPDRRMAAQYAVTSEAFGGPQAVGSCPQGASPCGALDMAGNAWEWTSSEYTRYSGSRAENDLFGKGLRVVRGGSWNFPLEQAQTTTRMPMAPRLWSPDVGFRCVLGVNP